jgi:hypothetical protein
MKSSWVAAAGIALALAPRALAATDVKWQVEKTTRWLAEGSSLSLRSTEAGAVPDVTFASGELTCGGCFFAALDGSGSTFDEVTSVPDTGYASTIAIGSTELAVVKFDDGSYAKLAIESTAYRAAQPGTNGAGVTHTFVLAAKE